MAPVPAGLFKPTAASAAPADDQGDAADDQGRVDGPQVEPRAPKSRKKRVPAGGESRGRKLILPDAVWERLELTAIRRKTTASAVAADLLDRNLPRLRIEQD